jgi:hypothetical protein
MEDLRGTTEVVAIHDLVVFPQSQLFALSALILCFRLDPSVMSEAAGPTPARAGSAA